MDRIDTDGSGDIDRDELIVAAKGDMFSDFSSVFTGGVGTLHNMGSGVVGGLTDVGGAAYSAVPGNQHLTAGMSSLGSGVNTFGTGVMGGLKGVGGAAMGQSAPVEDLSKLTEEEKTLLRRLLLHRTSCRSGNLNLTLLHRRLH